MTLENVSFIMDCSPRKQQREKANEERQKKTFSMEAYYCQKKMHFYFNTTFGIFLFLIFLAEIGSNVFNTILTEY